MREILRRIARRATTPARATPEQRIADSSSHAGLPDTGAPTPRADSGSGRVPDRPLLPGRSGSRSSTTAGTSTRRRRRSTPTARGRTTSVVLGLTRACAFTSKSTRRRRSSTPSTPPSPEHPSVDRRMRRRRLPDVRRVRASGDAVGAEEDAELGEEAVAGVDEEVVAEAEHGGLLGALEVHEHRAVAGVLGEDAP